MLLLCAGNCSFAEQITNHIGMKMVLIESGEYLIGSRLTVNNIAIRYGGKAKWFTDEKPSHRVVITKPFYIGIYEVTKAQYKAIMETNSGSEESDNTPVEQVSWMDAVEFCRILSRKEGKIYRLPTEAEWEYACRAGSRTSFYFGNDEKRLCNYAWFRKNADEVYPVGQKEPNKWGIYDMLGNVWEWCSDVYGKYNRKAGLIRPFISVKDPKGAETGPMYVMRGGGWNSPVYSLRCAVRLAVPPDKKTSARGFRCVMEYMRYDDE